MPDSGLLFLSLICVVAGVAFILFPHPLLNLSRALNRTLVTLDERLIHLRYLLGVLLFIASYLCFRLALFAAALRA